MLTIKDFKTEKMGRMSYFSHLHGEHEVILEPTLTFGVFYVGIYRNRILVQGKRRVEGLVEALKAAEDMLARTLKEEKKNEFHNNS